MPSSFPTPRVLRSEQTCQLSYDFSHRVHTTKVYPLTAPNGSQIILYGHQRGVRVVWRGGRPFKAAKPSAPAAAANGKSEDAVMIIDSDDEDNTSQPFEDNVDFEEHEEEPSPLKPYLPVLQYLDLEFGCDVFHISVPSAAVANADPGSKLAPPLVREKLVFAVSCGDASISLVTLPLTPPSPASKDRPELRKNFGATTVGSGIWGETVVKLSGASQTVSDGLSITFISKASAAKDRSSSEGRSIRLKSQKPSAPPSESWDVLLASHSRDVGGLLVIYRIPIIVNDKNGKQSSSLSKETLEPFQSHFLPAPAVTVSFNPSLSARSSTQLLLADKKNVVRILECLPTSTPQSPSAEEFEPLPSDDSGKWLVSLYPGFQKVRADSTNLPTIPRKNIIDAQWILGGKGVIVLLADGEWGIWDLEGTGPGSSRTIVGRQGLKGGANTSFSVSGWIEGLSTSKSSQRNTQAAQPSKFAPMTPSTRKSSEPSLFSNRPVNPNAQGQISVCSLRAASSTRAADESVTLWLDDSFSIIPNLAAFWEAHLRRAGGGGSLFNSTPANSRMLRLAPIELGGERCTSIDQIPLSIDNSQQGKRQGSVTEVVITAEHRLLIASQARADSGPSTSKGLFAAQKPSDGFASESLSRSDKPKQLFAPSNPAEPKELDLLGIEDALDRMEDSREIIEL